LLPRCRFARCRLPLPVVALPSPRFRHRRLRLIACLISTGLSSTFTLGFDCLHRARENPPTPQDAQYATP
jgi:hypothetical protein